MIKDITQKVMYIDLGRIEFFDSKDKFDLNNL